MIQSTETDQQCSKDDKKVNEKWTEEEESIRIMVKAATPCASSVIVSDIMHRTSGTTPLIHFNKSFN